MAQLIGPGTWSIQGETITLPVEITGAEITTAVFRGPAGGARSVLEGTPLKPLLVGGRSVSLLMCVHYGEWALKSYDEVGAGLLVRVGARPGLHFVDLPVTGAFTREAGQDFWGLPKWLMTADLRFGAGDTRITVRDGGRPVLDGTIGHGGRRLPSGIRAALPAWSFLGHGAQAGTLLHGKVPMHLQSLTYGRGTATLTLGDHPMAVRMRALGMTARPWFTAHAGRLHGPLGPYRPVNPSGLPGSR